MPDREKIMQGIFAHTGRNKASRPCLSCPYNGDIGCFTALLEDVLPLLKEQEPRVMKPEEIPNYDGAIYLEDFGEPEIVIAVYDRGGAGRVKFAIRGTRSTIAGYDDYNKRWRAWTSRPTDEQRKEVKWDA